MIKFFRRIRQQLLSGNKFSKYLIYASGEILLVMIGILLALQVNNWNSNRKDKKTRNKYLVELRQEAESDLKRLGNHIDNAQEYIEKVEANYLSKNETTIYNITKKDLDRIGIIRQTFFMNDDIYEEIISNGQLNILPENVKSTLMELSSLSHKINRIDDKSANNLNAQYLKMAEYFEVRRLNFTNQYEMTLADVSREKEGLLVYKNYINFCHDWMKTQLYFYGVLKNKYQVLIKLIEESDHQ